MHLHEAAPRDLLLELNRRLENGGGNDLKCIDEKLDAIIRLMRSESRLSTEDRAALDRIIVQSNQLAAAVTGVSPPPASTL